MRKLINMLIAMSCVAMLGGCVVVPARPHAYVGVGVVAAPAVVVRPYPYHHYYYYGPR